MTNEPMKAIDHTPRKNAPALIEEYRRGTIVAADGGRSARTEADGPAEDEPMSAIDHTPPRTAADVNRVFQRGAEEPVEATHSTTE